MHIHHTICCFSCIFFGSWFISLLFLFLCPFFAFWFRFLLLLCPFALSLFSLYRMAPGAASSCATTRHGQVRSLILHLSFQHLWNFFSCWVDSRYSDQ